jgi:hypothetical protein
MDHRWPACARGPESVRPALTIRISPSCANPAAPTTKSRSSTFSTARIAAPGTGSRETNVRNSESHGRGVVHPERPPVDPDLRRATSRARGSYLPRCAICRKTQCGGGSLIPGSSADGLQHPAVAHRYRRHRSWRPATSTGLQSRGHDLLCVALYGRRTGILLHGVPGVCMYMSFQRSASASCALWILRRTSWWHILGCHIEESKDAVLGLSDWNKPAPFGMLSATSPSGPLPAIGLACG